MNTPSSPVPPVAGRPKPRRQRLGIRLSQPTLQRLREFAAAKGRLESRIIEELVVAHLASGGSRHAESAPAGPIDRLADAINADRAERATEHRQLTAAIEVLSLAFDEFLCLWIGKVAAAAKRTPEETQRVIETLHGDLARHVAERFQSGRPFREDYVPARPNKTGAPTPPAARKGSRSWG